MLSLVKRSLEQADVSWQGGVGYTQTQAICQSKSSRKSLIVCFVVSKPVLSGVQKSSVVSICSEACLHENMRCQGPRKPHPCMLPLPTELLCMLLQRLRQPSILSSFWLCLMWMWLHNTDKNCLSTQVKWLLVVVWLLVLPIVITENSKFFPSSLTDQKYFWYIFSWISVLIKQFASPLIMGSESWCHLQSRWSASLVSKLDLLTPWLHASVSAIRS